MNSNLKNTPFICNQDLIIKSKNIGRTQVRRIVVCSIYIDTQGLWFTPKIRLLKRLNLSTFAPELPLMTSKQYAHNTDAQAIIHLKYLRPYYNTPNILTPKIQYARNKTRPKYSTPNLSPTKLGARETDLKLVLWKRLVGVGKLLDPGMLLIRLKLFPLVLKVPPEIL